MFHKNSTPRYLLSCIFKWSDKQPQCSIKIGPLDIYFHAFLNGFGIINPIHYMPFRDCSRMGRPKRHSPPYNLPHIPFSDETWHSYTLPKKDKKIYKSCHTILDFYSQQLFFKVNKQTLPYQEIQILIAFSYISSNSFNIFSVLKDFVNTSGYNFGMEGPGLSCHILKIKKNALIFGKKGP